MSRKLFAVAIVIPIMHWVPSTPWDWISRALQRNHQQIVRTQSGVVIRLLGMTDHWLRWGCSLGCPQRKSIREIKTRGSLPSVRKEGTALLLLTRVCTTAASPITAQNQVGIVNKAAKQHLTPIVFLDRHTKNDSRLYKHRTTQIQVG